MLVHWHPDNLIFVKNVNKEVIFYFTKEKIEEILNIQITPLPNGIIERQYYPNEYTADFSSNTQYQGPSVWEEGDFILSNLEILTQVFNLEQE